MRVGLIADSERQRPLAQLIRAAGHVVVDLAPSGTVAPDVPVVIGYLSAREQLPPIVAWARRERREGRFHGKVVFLSFLSNRTTRNRWSITGADVPGTTFVRLPATAVRFIEEAFAQAPTLTRTLLDFTIRENCCTADEIRLLTHDVANHAAHLVDRVSAGEQEATEAATELAHSLGGLSVILRALRETALADRCGFLIGQCATASLDTAPVLSVDLRRLTQSVNAAVCGDVNGMTWSPDGPSDETAPRGCDSVLIVDDDGYRNDCQDLLRGLGYEVTVTVDPKVALALQENDPRSVVISDLTFGLDPQAGFELFSALGRLSPPPLLIAMSSARIPPNIRPVVDGFCTGLLAKLPEGAKRLHAVVSTLARAKR